MSIQYDAALLQTVFKHLTLRTYKDEPEFLHTCRVELEPYVFGILNHRYGAELQRYWDSCTIPKGGDRRIVLVERRCHPNVKFCLQNAAYYARGWGITVICSDANEEYIRACVGSHVNSVKIIPLFKGFGTPEEGKTDYNVILQQTHFWNLFAEEHLLMMETDTYLMKPIPAEIAMYDYVASKWPWAPDAAGGGGLSFRRRSMMLKVCSQNFPIQKAQDCFISDAVEKMGFLTPTMEESTEFFGEFAFVPTVCGTHQWWTGIRAHDADTIMGALTLALV